MCGEHGLELLPESYQVFTLVCGKSCCLSFSSSTYQLMNLLMLSSSLLARSCGWSPGNAGPAEHLCAWLGDENFPLRGEDFSSRANSFIWLSVLPKVILSLKQYRDSFQILRGYIL